MLVRALSFVLFVTFFVVLHARKHAKPSINVDHLLNCQTDNKKNLNSLSNSFLNEEERSMLESVTKRVNFKQITIRESKIIVISTYRISPTSFAVISEIPPHSKILVDTCFWSNANSDFMIRTDVSILQGGWTVGYVNIILICNFKSFEKNASDVFNGGSLYIGEEALEEKHFVWEEKKDEYLKILHDHPLFQISFCSPPIFGKINYEIFSDWLKYHDEIVKIDHFNLYDYGSVPSVSPLLLPLIKKNKITVIRMINASKYSAWYHHQQTNNNDCLYRMKFNAEWVVFTDFDELVYTPPGGAPSFLAALLENSKKMQKNEKNVVPSFSLGSFTFYKKFCLPGSEKPDFPTSDENASDFGKKGKKQRSVFRRLVWRERLPRCVLRRNASSGSVADRNFCPNSYGHRKIVADTRLTHFVHIHKSVLPPERFTFHFNASMSASSPKLFHFRKVLSYSYCDCVVSDANRNVAKVVKTGVKDFSLSKLFEKMENWEEEES